MFITMGNNFSTRFIESNTLEIIIGESYYCPTIIDIKKVKFDQLVKNVIVNFKNLRSLHDIGGEFAAIEDYFKEKGAKNFVYAHLEENYEKLFKLMGYNIIILNDIEEALKFCRNKR